MKTPSIFLGLFALLWALSTNAQPYDEVSQIVRNVAVKTKFEGKTDIVVLYARGLCCPSCAIGVRKKVGGLDFVNGNQFKSGIELDARHQLVTVAVKKGQEVNMGQLAKAIDDAGYAPVHLYTLVDGKVVTRALSLTGDGDS